LGRVAHGRKWLDRYSGSEVSPAALQERGRMGELGLVTAIAVVVEENASLYGPVHLTGSGLSEGERALLSQAAEECERRLLALPGRALTDVAGVENELRVAIRMLFKQALAKRPNVLAVVIKI
jgi:mRNA degradation ribonuclease J1/J2